MTKTLAIIPVYNRVEEISSVVRDVKNIIPDVVVIDDGSTDGSRDAATAAGAEVIMHERNRGKGAALKTGFQYAIEKGFDAVITLDGDGQHSPQDIPTLIEKFGAGDIVIGSRMQRPSPMPSIIYWANRLFSCAISCIAGQTIRDTQSGFRLIHLSVLKNIRLKTSRYETETEILIKATRHDFSIAEVPVQIIYNTTKPRASILIDVWHFLLLLLSPHLYRS